jgi:hypothetical protein
MEESIQIFYDPIENRFSDECSDPIQNIYSLLSPNMVYLIKKKQEHMMMYDIYGGLVEIICIPF